MRRPGSNPAMSNTDNIAPSTTAYVEALIASAQAALTAAQSAINAANTALVAAQNAVAVANAAAAAAISAFGTANLSAAPPPERSPADTPSNAPGAMSVPDQDTAMTPYGPGGATSSGNGLEDGVLFRLSGHGSGAIEPLTHINLPGGTWGSGALLHGVAPITQNCAFDGTTENGQAGFAAFLLQTDHATIPWGAAGVFEQLLVGTNSVGWRGGGVFNVVLVEPSANERGEAYTGLTAKAILHVTDAPDVKPFPGSSAFGANFVAQVSNGVTASTVVGLEINTVLGFDAVTPFRAGLAIVDCLIQGASVCSDSQGSVDDVGLTLNNQYPPSETAGYKVGLEFGRWGGGFPVCTIGTLIGAQGFQGTGWKVGTAIGFGLGTVSDYWIQCGSDFVVNAAGDTQMGRAGFNGKAPVAAPTLSASSPTLAQDILAALNDYGLVEAST
jgi:hypothetical protein